MSTILGLDLGKFKSVACIDDPETTAARFTTTRTDPADLRKLMETERRVLVVFETCTVAGWVADLCAELGLPYAVANPMHEAWSWRKVRRKTDRGWHRLEQPRCSPQVLMPSERLGCARETSDLAPPGTVAGSWFLPRARMPEEG